MKLAILLSIAVLVLFQSSDGCGRQVSSIDGNNAGNTTIPEYESSTQEYAEHESSTELNTAAKETTSTESDTSTDDNTQTESESSTEEYASTESATSTEVNTSSESETSTDDGSTTETNSTESTTAVEDTTSTEASSTAEKAAQCGIPLAVTGRHKRMIIGGNTAPLGKWSWQVFVLRKYEEFARPMEARCGGTIISDRWILTAGHCADLDGDYEVLARITQRHDENATKLEVLERKLHPSYLQATAVNDIALIKLKTPLVFDHLASPICLPNLSQAIPQDGQAVAIGYGWANERGTTNTVDDTQLRETVISIVKPSICKGLFGDRLPGGGTFSNYKLICAGSTGHSVADGDSGGPLMMKASDDRWFQIGVTSFADTPENSAAGNAIPGGFTDVRQYCEWINEATEGEVKCQKDQVKLEDVEIV